VPKILILIIPAVILEMEARQIQENQINKVNKHFWSKQFNSSRSYSRLKVKLFCIEFSRRSKGLQGNSSNVEMINQRQAALKIVMEVHRVLGILRDLFPEAKAELKWGMELVRWQITPRIGNTTYIQFTLLI